MTTFALVHGAWHRGACWDPTATLLRDAGHDVVAPDLPCDDPAAGLAAGTATVVDALAARDAGDDVIEAFYHDCPPGVAAHAASLLRPQTWTSSNDPCPLVHYPDVASTAIVCTEDRVLSADACARHASERLGATVTRLGGGHSPMLAQPETLAGLLLDLV